MKKYLKLIPVILFFSCEKSINNYAIVIHGGAGTVIKENTSKELQKKYEDKLREALEVGYSILESGGAVLMLLKKQLKFLRIPNYSTLAKALF